MTQHNSTRLSVRSQIGTGHSTKRHSREGAVMRIHSNTLTPADLRDALTEAGLSGVWLDVCTPHRSRSRRGALEVRLAADPGKGRRRRNSGCYGAADAYAATYDEHGHWMARLYLRDPEALVGPYKSEAHFHELTRDAYRVARVAS